MTHILPQLDQHDKIRWTDDVEAERAANASRTFMEDHPDFYASSANADALVAWLDRQRVPITRRNLAVAYRVLDGEGKLERHPVQQVDSEPIDTSRGVQKLDTTVVLRHTIADTAENRAALVEELSQRREWAGPIGSDPKKSTLAEDHRKILNETAAQKTSGSAAYQAARQQVALANPGVRRDSAQFSRLVQQHLQSKESAKSLLRHGAKLAASA